MKIIATSDIHYHSAFKAATNKMVNDALAALGGPADVLMVLGDIGEHAAENFQTCLAMLAPLAKRRFCVPGNHDLYRKGLNDTDALRHHILPTMAQAEGYEYGPRLAREGNVVFLMNSCWHNLTWRSPLITPCSDEEARLRYKRHILDARALTTDYPVLHSDDMAGFTRDLREAERTVKADDVLIVGSHWPIMRESYSPFIPPEDRTRVDMSNIKVLAQYAEHTDSAFMAQEFGDMLTESVVCGNIKTSAIHVYGGHTHMGRRVKSLIRNRRTTINITVIESDYNAPGYSILRLP